MRIVVLDGWTLNPGDNPWDELAALGELTIFDRSARTEVVARAAGAEVLVINKVRLDQATLAQLPDLRFVTVTATGYDCMDVAAAREMGISVSNVPVYGTDSVAQHVFALLLHLIHRVDAHDAAIHAGEWQRRGDFSFWLSPLRELKGKQLGIVGLGRIGQQVARLAKAFGMHVVAHTRSCSAADVDLGVTIVSREELVATSDVISLHCPLTDQTRGLVDRAWLERMKPTAILINASRGPLVVEQDLANALNAGQIAAAALDVVSIEPIREDNPLLTARNCWLTPHLAWATWEARRRLMEVAVQNVAAYLAGRPQNVVNSG